MSPLESQLRADVAGIAAAAGRMAGSAGHTEARRFLCTRPAELRLEPYHGAAGYPLPCRHGGPACDRFVARA